eukprot:TRINITY_DN14555_c0_g1_i1.p2 TRINITY_DN14555_c0_g1~~TRINITY_DN14555_c0_g1_i1.p2  ORF type:complete len:230 (+),score=36.49 TRINITY_DN14555_c0_g1_i1:723-1412(+)
MTASHMQKLVAGADAGTLKPGQRKEISEMSTFADIANDECDYGHGLEVGLNYFCFAKPGGAAEAEGFRLLDLAYCLLGRDLFQSMLKDIRKRRAAAAGLPAAAAAHRPPSAAPPAAAPPATPPPATVRVEPDAKRARVDTGALPLAGAVIVLSGFVNPERGELKKVAGKLGAKIDDDWGSSSTHLICAYSSTPKRKKAEASGRGFIVAKSWLAKCSETGTRVPESLHPI